MSYYNDRELESQYWRKSFPAKSSLPVALRWRCRTSALFAEVSLSNALNLYQLSLTSDLPAEDSKRQKKRKFLTGVKYRSYVSWIFFLLLARSLNRGLGCRQVLAGGLYLSCKRFSFQMSLWSPLCTYRSSLRPKYPTAAPKALWM